MKNIALLLLACASFTACSLRINCSSDCAAKPPEKTAIAACKQVLDAQVVAWNSGNIEAFAAGYRKAPDIVMASKGGVELGFDAVVAGYRKSYGTPELMGTLRFDSVSYVTLSADETMVLGAWHLKRVSDEPHGRFALVLRLFPEGWRIVLDYTSELP